MKMKILALSALLFAFCLNAQNTDISNDANEIVKIFEVEKDNNFFKDLFYNKNVNYNDVISEFKSNIETYNPSSIYALASYYYLDGKIDLAVEYAIMAKIRATFDFRRSVDNSTKDVVKFFDNNYAKFLPDYIMDYPYKFEDILKKVIHEDKKTKYVYNPKWIYLYTDKFDSLDLSSNLIYDNQFWDSLYRISVAEVNLEFIDLVENAKKMHELNKIENN